MLRAVGLAVDSLNTVSVTGPVNLLTRSGPPGPIFNL